jgi:hypothetical protein
VWKILVSAGKQQLTSTFFLVSSCLVVSLVIFPFIFDSMIIGIVVVVMLILVFIIF